MKISIIAAVAENGIIGNNNNLPWHIKSEWQYFIKMTKNKPIIMGRKTFESLGKPLKDRSNIIVTRDKSYKGDGIIVTHTIENALNIAKKIARDTKQDEIMIGGGAEIYKLALPLSDRLYLTTIHLNPQGDTKFPKINKEEWLEVKSEFHQALSGETSDYTIKVFDIAN